MSSRFQIDVLSVRNYRRFPKLTVSFDPELTVLVARNGEGKTAVLDAVRIAYGTFTRHFPVSANASFQVSDVHVAAGAGESTLGAVYPVSLEASGLLDGRKVAWSRALRKAGGRTTTKEARALSDYGLALYQATQRSEGTVDLPLVACYGTGRLWPEPGSGSEASASLLAGSRFAGYEQALAAGSSYRQVRQWLIEALQMEDSRTASATPQGRFVATQLRAVRTALAGVLDAEGLGGMHYNPFHKDDVTVMGSDGGRSAALPVSWLSDGIRAVFSLVADIAYRCAKLNPHLGEQCCRKTPGIVLVDEIDIFLHPAWQQHVLRDLRKAFPDIQFIVATHSPQVLSSVPGRCIRLVEHGEVSAAGMQTQGVESQDILAQVFGTDPAPPDDPFVSLLASYARLEARGETGSDEGRRTYRKLAAHFGESYPPLQRIEIHRRFLERRGGTRHA